MDDRVVAEARRMERARASGKVVVYWRRMEQAKGLAERLGCGVFYSAVDGAEGKARRLREWMAAGRLMVATKAMGVGLDVADVRGVMHAGAAGRLREGRGRRGGERGGVGRRGGGGGLRHGGVYGGREVSTCGVGRGDGREDGQGLERGGGGAMR